MRNAAALPTMPVVEPASLRASLVAPAALRLAQIRHAASRPGASVAGTIMQRNPGLGAELKFVLKDSPNFIGVAKGEDKLRAKVNEIIAAAKPAGELDKLAQKWLGRPAGDLPN